MDFLAMVLHLSICCELLATDRAGKLNTLFKIEHEIDE